jgi:hypothetical protein
MRFVGDWRCGYTTINPDAKDYKSHSTAFTIQFGNNKFWIWGFGMTETGKYSL